MKRKHWHNSRMASWSRKRGGEGDESGEDEEEEKEENLFKVDDKEFEDVVVTGQLRASAAAAAAKASKDAALDLATGAQGEDDAGYLADGALEATMQSRLRQLRRAGKKDKKESEAEGPLRSVVSAETLLWRWHQGVAASAKALVERSREMAGASSVTESDSTSVVRFKEPLGSVSVLNHLKSGIL